MPPPFNTKSNIPQEMLDIYSKFNALPYNGEADDIGHAVLFLASDKSKFMTGQTLQIEGGHYLANLTIADTNNWVASLQNKA